MVQEGLGEMGLGIRFLKVHGMQLRNYELNHMEMHLNNK